MVTSEKDSIQFETTSAIHHLPSSTTSYTTLTGGPAIDTTNATTGDTYGDGLLGLSRYLFFLLLIPLGFSIGLCLASYWKVETLGNDGNVDYTVLFYHRSLKVQAVNIGNGGGDPVDLLGVNYATCIAESEQQGPSYAG